MRIVVNKNQQRINFNTHVWTIIEIAKQKAEAGIDRFDYKEPKASEGLKSSKIAFAVEEETEGTVKLAFARYGSMHFKISKV